MTNTPPLFAAVTAWISRYRPLDPDTYPAAIRMHPETFAALRTRIDATARPDRGFGPPPGYGTEYLTGLAVTLDHDLPPGVWRTCTADGRLLHDSRSGRKGHP